MASIKRMVSGHGAELALKSQPDAPTGGTNKGDMNTNKKLKQATNYGNSGMSGYAAATAGVEAEGSNPKKSSLNISAGTRNISGGKFPNMMKDVK